LRNGSFTSETAATATWIQKWFIKYPLGLLESSKTTGVVIKICVRHLGGRNLFCVTDITQQRAGLDHTNVNTNKKYGSDAQRRSQPHCNVMSSRYPACSSSSCCQSPFFKIGPSSTRDLRRRMTTPVKDYHTRIKPLALASGHGRCMTIAPERTPVSAGEWPLHLTALIKL
jgi:hypothetical protein